MKAGGSKRKGGQFERDVCKTLSLWRSSGQNEDWYWRSSMSGGRATVAKKSGKVLKSQCGDISSIDPKGADFTEKYYVEVKHVKSYKLDRFLLLDKGKMAKAWETCVKEAKSYNKVPMLISNLSSLGIVMVLPSYINFSGLEHCWKIIVPDINIMVLNFKQVMNEWKWIDIIS